MVDQSHKNFIVDQPFLDQPSNRGVALSGLTLQVNEEALDYRTCSVAATLRQLFWRNPRSSLLGMGLAVRSELALRRRPRAQVLVWCHALAATLQHMPCPRPCPLAGPTQREPMDVPQA